VAPIAAAANTREIHTVNIDTAAMGAAETDAREIHTIALCAVAAAGDHRPPRSATPHSRWSPNGV
jgi:hypothetical protein